MRMVLWISFTPESHTRASSRPITRVQMQNDSGRFESIQTTICEIAERE